MRKKVPEKLKKKPGAGAHGWVPGMQDEPEIREICLSCTYRDCINPDISTCPLLKEALEVVRKRYGA